MRRYYAWLLVVTAMVITNVTYGFYDPNLQRWVNRDPIEELGGINLYRIGRNNPVRFVDAFGLVIVQNNSDQRVMAEGNPGTGGKGHGSKNPKVYVVVPPGGKCGGLDNPLPGYATPDEARAASDNPLYGHSTGDLYDVDNINGEKYRGDLAGPLVTIQNGPGGIVASRSTVEFIWAFIRTGLLFPYRDIYPVTAH